MVSHVLWQFVDSGHRGAHMVSPRQQLLTWHAVPDGQSAALVHFLAPWHCRKVALEKQASPPVIVFPQKQGLLGLNIARGHMSCAPTGGQFGPLAPFASRHVPLGQVN